jgi:sterol desaturase/sphingolipid hydroxylase (fatty acid hydroxylase superfamily)
MEVGLESLLTETATAGLAGTIIIYGVSLIGATIHYGRTANRQDTPLSFKGLAAHLFPLYLIMSRWTWLDILVYALDKALFVLVFPSVAGLVVLVATGTQAVLGATGMTAMTIPQSTGSMILFLICGLVARDCASFHVHFLQHRLPFLWEFHKVHHAPESLIPATSFRLHPIDQITGIAAESLFLGIVAGIYAWLTQQNQSHLIVCSVGFYMIVNIFTFAPLRHSHIDLRLGPLEWILLSPAHHHVHHSLEPDLWDKNFGTIFRLWDRLWNTLVDPPQRGSYRLGLPDGESNDYASLWGCYITPFLRLGLTPRKAGPSPVPHVDSHREAMSGQQEE